MMKCIKKRKSITQKKSHLKLPEADYENITYRSL